MIVTNGLVGYWNSKKGIVKGVWENLAPATKGQYNGWVEQTSITPEGLYFNGTSSIANLPLPTQFNTITPLTLELRVNVDVPSVVTELITHGDRPLIFFERTGGRLWLNVDMGSEVLTFWSYSDFSSLTKTELYITLTLNLNTNVIEFYRNGQPVDTYIEGAIQIINLFKASQLTLGQASSIALSAGGERVKGIIDGIRLYNRVLTDAEILQNYQVGREIGLPVDPDITGPPARLYSDGRLEIAGELIEGQPFSLDTSGNLKVMEIVEGNRLGIDSNGVLYVKEIIERD